MKCTAVVALAAALTLAACSGQSSSTTRVPTGNAHLSILSTHEVQLAPYTLPLVNNAASQAIEAQQAARHPLSYGGIPTILAWIFLIDAPSFGPNSQVNLSIVGIEGLSGGVAYPLVSYSPAISVNMLSLTTGALNMGQYPLQAQKYDGIRLLVDPTQSTIVNDGKTYSTTFGVFSNHTFAPGPTGIANVDFAQPFDASSGNVSLLIDFNVAESVKLLPSGIAEIGPTIAAVPMNQSAVVDGNVTNSAGTPVSGATIVASTANGSVAATTVSRWDGSFEIHAIPGGTYTLSVYNTFLSRTGDTVTAVNADGTGSVAGPSFTVPVGYRANVGTIAD